MPELPEVETTRRGLAPLIEGQALRQFAVHQPMLRWPVSIPNELPGHVVQRLRRRGKYLLFDFEHGSLIVHLGMSGSLRFVERETPRLLHDHVELDFGGVHLVRLNDPRRFGCVLWQPGGGETHPLLASLGPEPLENEFSGQGLFEKARARKVAVKLFVMNSHIVVGVGNIYANEALFLAGVRPTRAAGRIPRGRFEDVARAIRMVLDDSIRVGGTTLRDFLNPEGKPGYFRQSLRVYDRADQPCVRCGAGIESVVLGGRSTYYCPSCQPSRGFGPVSCKVLID